MLTNVYVDGFNLYYGCLKGPPHKWLDLEALCARLLPQNQIKRIRYFTARISARPGDVHGPVHQDAYLRALTTLPTASVHLGHFLTNTTRMPVAGAVGRGHSAGLPVAAKRSGGDTPTSLICVVLARGCPRMRYGTWTAPTYPGSCNSRDHTAQPQDLRPNQDVE